MITVSPAARQAALSRDTIEAALLEIKGLPGRVDRRVVVEAFEDALAALHELQQSSHGDADHLDLLEASRARVMDARVALELQDVSERTRRLVTRIQAVERTLENARAATIDAVVALQNDVLVDRTRVGGAAKPVAARPLHASLGLPSLHSPAREPLRTAVDAIAPDELIFEEIEPPDEELESKQVELADALGGQGDDEEAVIAAARGKAGLDDDIQPDDVLPILGHMRHTGPAAELMQLDLAGELAQLKRLCRDCLEEMGGLANLLRLRKNDRFRWRKMIKTERRLLESLDATMSLSTSFASNVAPGAIHPGIDILTEALEYARDAATADPSRAFARAFVLGCVDGEDTIRAAVLALKQSHPYTFDAQGHALSIAPSTKIEPAMLRLSADSDERLVALALRVLRAREAVHYGSVVSLFMHPSTVVRTAAATALEAVPERDAAIELLTEALDTELDDTVRGAMAQSLVVASPQRALPWLRAELDADVEEPGMLRQELRSCLMQLLAIVGDQRDSERLSELYLGTPEESLALGFHGDKAHVPVLIDVLSGRGQIVSGPVMRAAAAQALSRITGAPLQRKVEPEDFDFYDIITDHDAWTKWWNDNEDKFDPAVRYRFGDPYVPVAGVVEMQQPEVPLAMRSLCALELAVWLKTPPMSHIGFAVAQLERLDGMRASLEAMGTSPGSWLSPRTHDNDPSRQ